MLSAHAAHDNALEIIMDKRSSTTPYGVFPTPLASMALPNAEMTLPEAYDAGVAQMWRLHRAEACLDPSGYDASLRVYEAEAADARAKADTLLEAFYYADTSEHWYLSTAAWVMLLILQSDGLDLYLIAQRSAGLRRTAAACARSPLPEEAQSADRLLAAAEVIDAMVEAAIDDYAAIDPDHIDDLRGLVDRGLAAAIDREKAQRRPDDPNGGPEPDFSPC